MYYFLYKASRHKTTGFSRKTKIKSSYMGDFDIKLLRQGTQYDIKIIGHSKFELQKKLLDNDIDVLTGHFIVTNDPMQSVWIKLNYDLICRPGTELMGIYQNLHECDIDNLMRNLNEVTKKLISVTGDISDRSNAKLWMNRLEKSFESFDNYKTRDLMFEHITKEQEKLIKIKESLIEERKLIVSDIEYEVERYKV